MRKLLAQLLLTLLLIGLGSLSVHAQTPDPDVITLKGISALGVLVESLNDKAKGLGLSKEAIQTDVELRLRLAGMRVVTMKESGNFPGGPFLYVACNVVGNAANIEVTLTQRVLLERNVDIGNRAKTWGIATLTVNGKADEIRNAIKDLVDEFLNAWLSVNPKK